MKKSIALLAVAILPFQAVAQAQTYGIDLPKLFLHGERMSDIPPLPPDSQVYRDSVAAMKALTGSDAPIQYYWRVTKMKRQPTCGRVSMIPIQKNVALGQFAIGTFLCEDGTPPLMVCPEKKSQLVSPTAQCKNGTSPVFTDEAQVMYDQAIKDGGKTTVEIMKRLKDAEPKK
jgi:hypothetical protein